MLSGWATGWYRGLVVGRGMAVAGLQRHPSQIHAICQVELGWDDARWKREEAGYVHLWQTTYSLQARGVIPDWYAWIADTRLQREAIMPARSRMIISRTAWLGILIALWREF
jgi:hypothetical protein